MPSATRSRDPKVRAILFRIDSPGGSVTASETIWHDVVFARERGKPVIVSMGNVAGSGGYYVAAPADKIVAEPATLTGSIGVLAGKLVVADLLKKIGVSTDAAQFGANAAMFSATSDFSPLARGRLQAFLDATYQGFKDHVAAGRHLTPDAVEAIAQGRVWSGEEAKANGLVDALGGYEVALRLAKEVGQHPGRRAGRADRLSAPRGPRRVSLRSPDRQGARRQRHRRHRARPRRSKRRSRWWSGSRRCSTIPPW